MAAPPPFQSKRPPSSFARSLLHAWDGLIHTVVHQRNMRMHVLAAILVGLVGSGIPLGLAEKVTLVFCVLLVLFAEMLNSALEQLVDLATQQFDERAKLVKDIAAAGVLVLAIGTVVIFAAVVVHNAQTVLANASAVQRQVLVGVPIAAGAGVLMHEQTKPLIIDLLAGAIALGGWVAIESWTESEVFSAMTLGLLLVCVATAHARRATPTESPRQPTPRSGQG